MKGGIATSSNFLSGEPAFIMPFDKYSFFLKSIIIKALKILRLMQSAQGLTPCTPTKPLKSANFKGFVGG
jgi:hypothetical protein